jgi:hypothetical protein
LQNKKQNFCSPTKFQEKPVVSSTHWTLFTRGAKNAGHEKFIGVTCGQLLLPYWQILSSILRSIGLEESAYNSAFAVIFVLKLFFVRDFFSEVLCICVKMTLRQKFVHICTVLM